MERFRVRIPSGTVWREERAGAQKGNMAVSLRVLHIEDSEDDALLMLRELRGCGYDPYVRRVQSRDEMETALREGTWDLVISDYIMPLFSGLDALKLLKESGIDLPFIIVSGKIGEDVAVDAMRAGAHDYILKGNLARLCPAIARELRDAETRRERRLGVEALKKAYDELEVRVRERTAELSGANAALKQEIEQRIRIQKEREDLIEELRRALAKVKTLSGLLPICASCKKIRDDGGYWNQIESYISKHSEAEFSHGLCPECAGRLYPEIFGDKRPASDEKQR
jgi:FixJ family two-component response regulator